MRRVALRRSTPMRRSRRRVGEAARARVKAGGKRAVGRDSLSLDAWRALVAEIVRDCHGLCEYHGNHQGCDPHHVRKASAGGADDKDNIVWLCRLSHEMTDAAYGSATGRLLVLALEHETFDFLHVVGHKHHYTVIDRVRYRRTKDGPRWERQE